jgi:ribose 5-phosphate isomerase RpiB
MKIAIGSDHGGFELKEYIKAYFDTKGIKYVDFGTHSLDPLIIQIMLKKLEKLSPKSLMILGL